MNEEIIELRYRLAEAQRIIEGYLRNEAWYYSHLIDAREESAELSKHLAALSRDYDLSCESVVHLTKIVKNQKAMILSEVVAHGKSLDKCQETTQKLQDKIIRLKKKAKGWR